MMKFDLSVINCNVKQSEESSFAFVASQVSVVLLRDEFGLWNIKPNENLVSFLEKVQLFS